MKRTRSEARAGVSRRSLLKATAAALGTPLLARSNLAHAQDKLAGKGEVVVFSFGGSYTAAMRKNVYEPFTKATGITVVDVTADFSEPQIRAMHQSGRVDWDIGIPQAYAYPAMHEAGIFVPVDYSLWDDESIKGVAEVDRQSDFVVKYGSGTLLAYDTRSFPKGGPKSWADFWSAKDFPGGRSLLGANPKHNFSFALNADGLPNSQRWPMTDDKVDRALRKLDEIKPSITKWWTAGGEPPQLLMNREIAMTSCYDGRALALIRQGAPIRLVWDGGW